MSNLPEKATGVLEMFSTSLTGVNIFSDQLIEAIREGELNPIEARVRIKAIEMALDRVKKETNYEQLNAADKYETKSFEAYGAKIERSELGTSYDYSICNDEVWNSFNERATSAMDARKEREEFLKALKQPMVVVSQDTGEVTTIHPPLKKSTSGLKITIK